MKIAAALGLLVLAGGAFAQHLFIIDPKANPQGYIGLWVTCAGLSLVATAVEMAPHFRKPVSPLLGDFVHAVVASKLPRDRKLALLGEGAGHDDLDHCRLALSGLADLDLPLFRKHLIATLGRMPAMPAREKGWILDWEDVSLVERSEDPACWDALAAAKCSPSRC